MSKPTSMQPDLFTAGREIVCWTRMQAEAGQDLQAIITRKELERRAGAGVFFWGIGNSLGDRVASLKRFGLRIPVLFSRMISAPKTEDSSPTGIVVWNAFEEDGRISRLPPHALITSRSHTSAGPKTRHYALVCKSDTALQIQDYGPLDHTAYRNFGGGRPVGASQVTALLERWRSEKKASARYRINLRAVLTGLQFIRLADPSMVRPEHVEALKGVDKLSDTQWRSLLKEIRAPGACYERV